MPGVWAHLKADPIIRITGLLYTGLVLVYWIPWLSSPQLANLSEDADLVFSVLAVWALLYGVRQIKHPEERRFWLLAAFGFAAWVVVESLHVLAPNVEAPKLETAEGSLALLNYAAILLAVAANPHLKSGWSRGNPRYWITSAASLVFVLGSVTYVFLIQTTAGHSTEPYVPNLLMYVALDGLVAGTFAYLSGTCGSIRWRNLYATLAVASGLWVVLGSLDLLSTWGVWPFIPEGNLHESAVPYLPIIAAARLRHYASPQQAPAEDDNRVARQTPARLGGSPILFLVVLPLFHFGGYWTGMFSPDARLNREFLMLFLVLVLAALAFANQKQLESERRILEERARQSQKMEAIGTLAGGVAHDFNNLLTGITGFASLAQESMSSEHPAYEDITEVLKTSERAATLTRQLLAFSRQQTLEPAVLQVNSVVEEFEPMLQRLLPEYLDFVLAPNPELGNVRMDRGELEQVIVNLVVNARDAMLDGGILTIGTRPETFDSSFTREGVVVDAGDYCLLSVSDTGSGIAPQTLLHVFDPFFTTKPQGEGSGMGLAMVYGVVKQTGGYIFLDSVLDLGTTVTIYLPSTNEPATLPAQPADSRRTIRGNETILLVEDDDAVADVAERTLQQEGYRVLRAPGPEEALRIHNEHGEAIDLLLTDVVLPTMSGIELDDRICADRPDLPVLFMSGYKKGPSRSRLESANFLRKPFTPEALARKVREVLLLAH